MNESGAFISIRKQVDTLRKEAESHDTAARLYDIAFNLGELYKTTLDCYNTKQLTRGERGNILQRISDIRQYIQDKEVRE